ncbi:endonuclease III [Chlamydiota bacterium]
MKREARKRLFAIIVILEKIYPESKTALIYKTPFELLVATILSAQCTDKKVNEITPLLFKKYRSVTDFAHAEQTTLEQEIRPTGFFRNKAKNIIQTAQRIVKEYNGLVPNSMAELVTLAGVARKTANIMLSSCFGKVEGIAVDTHVKRLAKRIGFSQQKDPDKIEKDLMEIIPHDKWMRISYILVDHGRAICDAKKPQCVKCPINELCPSRDIFFPSG